MTTMSNFDVREVPLADSTFIKTGLFASRERVFTEIQCTSNEEVEMLMAATLKAVLHRLSPIRLLLLTLNSIFQYSLIKLESILFNS